MKQHDTTPFDPVRFQAALTTAAIGRYLVYRPTTETTMVLARREADEGAPHGTLVLAEEQTAGRGRRGRSFSSPPAENLYFTLVLRLPLEVHKRLPAAAPVAVCKAIAAEGVAAAIKWPNDIWAGERKLCGMLIDAELEPGGAIAMPGIGINVNGDPTLNPELANIATSIRRELGRPVSRELLLARICNELELSLALPSLELADRYREGSMILGRAVLVQPAAAPAYEAIAATIEDDGSLRVTRSDGRSEVVTSADVSLRPV